MRRLCLVVPRQRAEDVRQELLKKDLLEKHLTILKEGTNILFPVKQKVDMGFAIEERDFPEAFKPIGHYSDVVEIPEKFKSLLPSSLDIIGDVALIRLPKDLRGHGTSIGKAILNAYKNVRCVFSDEGIAGEYRIRKVSNLAGENRTRTVHKEYGLTYTVDVAKAYFSPRLATERVRVVEQVEPGEVVLDLFTGVGPYAIMIAKKRSPLLIHAVDNNPDAIDMLEENIRKNKVENVRPFLGDAHKALKIIDDVDRLVMDLPQSAKEFYIDALRCVKNGGMMHYYEILDSVTLDEHKEDLVKEAGREGTEVEILSTRAVKTYSPAQQHFAFDIKVS